MSTKFTAGAPKRRAMAVGMVAVAALVIAAWGASSSLASGSSGSQKKFTFVLDTGLSTDPFYIKLASAATAEAKKLGVKLDNVPETVYSPSDQVPAIESLLAEHPSALIIAPTDAVALKAPIQKYVSAGIPVVTVDNTINDTKLLTSRITSNNVQGPAGAANALAKLVHDTGEVAIESNSPGISDQTLRIDSFKKALKKYPKMKLVTIEYDNNSATTAESQVRNMILAHPGLVGIFVDQLAGTEGAGEAIKADDDKGKVFVAGYDGTPQEVALLREGYVRALVVQKPAVEGTDAVLYAYDKLTGKASKIRKSVLITDIIATTQPASDKSASKYYRYISSFAG